MAAIRVTIANEVGVSTHRVELPNDVAVEKLLKVLPSRLGRPSIDPYGSPLRYQLYLNQTELRPDATLAQSGVKDDDTLSLMAEATAGVDWLKHSSEVGGRADEFFIGSVLPLIDTDTLIQEQCVVRFDIDGKWTARDFAKWLGTLDTVYWRLSVFLDRGLDDVIYQSCRRAKDKLSSDGEGGEFAVILAAGRRRGVDLRINQVRMASPGFIELIGSLNPLKVMADFISAWRAENSLREQGRRQTKIEVLKIKTELAKVLIERNGSLRAGMPDDIFVDRFVRFVLDEPREMLEDVAKDIRLEEVSWRREEDKLLSSPSQDRERPLPNEPWISRGLKPLLSLEDMGARSACLPVRSRSEKCDRNNGLIEEPSDLAVFEESFLSAFGEKPLPACRCGLSEEDCHSPLIVFFTQQALESLWSRTRLSASINSEDGGVLVGEVYRVFNRAILFSEVSGHIEARYTKVTETSIEFTTRTWDGILAQRRRLPDQQRVVGWYHTHPPRRPDLSAEDYDVHRALFDRPWQVAIVLDRESAEMTGFCLVGHRVRQIGLHVLGG